MLYTILAIAPVMFGFIGFILGCIRALYMSRAAEGMYEPEGTYESWDSIDRSLATYESASDETCMVEADAYFTAVHELAMIDDAWMTVDEAPITLRCVSIERCYDRYVITPVQIAA